MLGLAAFRDAGGDRRRHADLAGAALRGAPVVEDRGLLHAVDRAVRGAALGGVVLAAQVLGRIAGQRDAGGAALLRAVVHQAGLVHVQVARPCAAAPLVGAARDQLALPELVDAGDVPPRGLALE